MQRYMAEQSLQILEFCIKNYYLIKQTYRDLLQFYDQFNTPNGQVKSYDLFPLLPKTAQTKVKTIRLKKKKKCCGCEGKCSTLPDFYVKNFVVVLVGV